MKFEVRGNANYAAVIVELKNFAELPGAKTVQAAIIEGNSVIVSKDAKAGDRGIFFPVESKLSQDFLSSNNLYREKELNKNPELKGYFEQHGRVRAMKFMGLHKSEGFFIPLTSLEFIRPFTRDDVTLGTTFDTFEGVQICEKYIPKNAEYWREQRSENRKRSKADKKLVRFDRLIDGQFKLHSDMYSVA